MNFILTESTKVKEETVTVTVSNEFNSYFNTLMDFAEYQNIENLEAVLEYDHDIEDLILITIQSGISRNETSFASHKNSLSSFLENLIKSLENKEEYELCSVFNKILGNYKTLINEK